MAGIGGGGLEEPRTDGGGSAQKEGFDSGSESGGALNARQVLSVVRQHFARLLGEYGLPAAPSRSTRAIVGLTLGRTPVADAAHTQAASDVLIAYTSLSAGRTVTLLVEAGRLTIVKDESGAAGTHNITVQGVSGNIDGAANYVINTNYGGVGIYCNGTDFFTVF